MHSDFDHGRSSTSGRIRIATIAVVLAAALADLVCPSDIAIGLGHGLAVVVALQFATTRFVIGTAAASAALLLAGAWVAATDPLFVELIGRACAVGLIVITAWLGLRVRSDWQAAMERERFLVGTLLDTVPDVIYFKDAEGRFLRVNPAFLAAVDATSPDEVLGTTDRDYFTPEQAEEFLEDERRIMRTREPLVNKEEWETWQDGRRRCVLVTKLPLLDESGDVVGTFGVTRDITAVKETEFRLRIALEGGDIGLWDWEIATGNVEFSAVYNAQLGEPPVATVGTFDDWQRRLHPDDHDAAVAAAAAYVESPQGVYDQTFRMRHLDGGYRTMLARGRFATDLAGTAVRMVGVHVDITDRAEREEELKRTRDRLDLAIGNSVAGVWDWRLDGDEVWCSPRMLELLGDAGDPSSPSPGPSVFLDRLHPDDREATRSAFNRHIEQGEPLEVECRLLTANSVYRWFRARGDSVRDETGRAVRVSGSLEDVTERRASRLALEASEARWRRALVDAPIPIMLHTEDGEIRLLNSAWSRITGYGPREIATVDDWSKLAYGANDDGSTLRIEIATLFEHDTTHDEGAFHIRTKSGEMRTWHFHSASLEPLPDGRPLVISMATDVTDVERYTSELAAKTRELERSNSDLDRFAYVASHDLKAPLQGIDNISQWLLEDVGESLPETSRGHLDKMIVRVRRMKQLLDDLLVFSRIGRREDQIHEVDIPQMVRDIVEDDPRAEGFDVRVDTDAFRLVTAVAPLRQILGNLLSNAFKHHDRATGEVVVTARRAGESLVVTVQDDGPGIPPEYHDRVFELFKQLRPKSEVEGSGMGLAIVKRTIEQRGGTIEVESDRQGDEGGRGTRFRFTWPLGPSISEPPTVSATE